MTSQTKREETTKEITKTRKNESFRPSTHKQHFLKISVSLQTAFAAETHLAEGQ
jgi:hypothetical protein